MTGRNRRLQEVEEDPVELIGLLQHGSVTALINQPQSGVLDFLLESSSHLEWGDLIFPSPDEHGRRLDFG